MEEYEPSSANLQDFFQNGVYESEEAKNLELPQWFLAALARGLLAPFVSDALVLRRTLLHVQVENMQRSSAHATALPIRQVIYGLLPNISPSSPTFLNQQSTSSSSIFREFDRIQKALKKSFVQAAVLPDNFCGDRYSLITLNKVSLADRMQLLLDTLGVTASVLEPIPCCLQLPIAVTCYWIKNTEPRVKLPHMKALLIGIVFGELEKTLYNSDPEVSCVEVNKIVHGQFCKWKGKKSPKESLELDAAHIFCQWQCCLQMGLYLNQLLCNPLPEPELSWLYCGTLVHRLYHELKSSSVPEDLLSTSPKLYQLYCNMVHVVKDATPAGFFQKKSKKHRKQSEQTSDHVLHERECTALEVVPSCSINNRFATLMVNN
ncbi:hypothetical protein JRQ81_018836 [Phrynocephalus forsythii]|uniref:Uncharacterized protein n=1 Tax=Phrynocephalus forsythii TaxID=171643 RepID=A0A9Q1AZS8_9SAUR|nr:hypothetical protein JRQ81_018836 [Phrynocephalus forsythii]